MPTPQTETPRPITISTNCILNGKFYVVGSPLPVERAEDLPETLQPLVVVTDAAEESDEEEENAPRCTFQLNEVYQTTENGGLGLGRALKRKVERQVAELQAENEFEEQLAEEAANAELPPEVARDLQDAHDAHVGLQKAKMAAAARVADDITDAAIAESAPPQLFVKRGGRHYARADKARRKPGEDVFIKDTDGTFQFIGTTDSRADLPEPPVKIT